MFGSQPRSPGRRVGVVLACLGALLGGCGGDGSTGPDGRIAATTANPGQTAPSLGLAAVADGLAAPTQVVPLPDSEEIWVVEQAGVVKRVVDGDVAATPALDISSRVASGGERGLLSIALHPRFPGDPRAFLHLSDPAGNTRVEEHRVRSGIMDPSPARLLLSVEQPYSNHNGGSLAFGPDGRLYLGLGDGGSANDPEERSQDMSSKLGKLLRVDIDDPAAEWEIAALGLRNPWRFSFDPATGDAWIGDVGQGASEEVDVFPRGSGLRNYGWDVYEGRDRASSDDTADLNPAGTLTPPVAQYSHDDGCSITGGVVVRNTALASLNGRYLYGDYCSGTIWSVPLVAPFTPRREPIELPGLASIDISPTGAVYLTSQRGSIVRVAQSS